MSKVRLRGLASECASLPVMRDISLALAPLIAAFASLVRRQASLPYVRTDVIAALKIFSLVPTSIPFASKQWRSCPHLLAAKAILRFMSYICSPSAAKREPRYLNLKTFFSSLSSHFIFGLLTCASDIFVTFATTSAFVPLKHCCSPFRSKYLRCLHLLW